MQQLEERFARYAAHRLSAARDVRADSFARIHGGASRETYRLRLRYVEDGRERERRLIRHTTAGNDAADTRHAPHTGYASRTNAGHAARGGSADDTDHAA